MAEPAQTVAKPALSVVVVVYNIPREAPRTLLSLSASYQRQIAAEDYEVIVVDNGSSPPFDERVLDGLAGNFRLIRMDPAFPSPAPAINRGLREARGDVIGVMVDGARIVTPGMLHFARQGAYLYPRSVVATLGWYLGADIQKFAIEGGHDRAREDALLASINWPEDGYRLFEIATPDESSIDGWLYALIESNALFLRRELWELLGGVDERFDVPGGGMVNPDTFKRAVELPGADIVLLLGEGTFHQVHGGVATNSKLEEFVGAVESWHAQYTELHGGRFKPPPQERATYLGSLPRGALFRLVTSAVHPVRGRRRPALGASFDPQRWALEPAQPRADEKVAALVRLVQSEFNRGQFQTAAAVARLARSYAPDEPELLRLLALIGPALFRRVPREGVTADFHAALGEAYAILGDHDRAGAEFRTALALDVNSSRSYAGLSRLRMPGDPYRVWLRRIHLLLRPQFYVEIGVNRGKTLALAAPPTVAIGVDPAANVAVQFQTATHIFPETSDDFFAQNRLEPLLRGRPVALGFIDGLHLFEQALRDFIQLEAYCDASSVILFHDTFPIAEAAQQRERRMSFHTGDVWRVVLCLKHYRPDLEIFTIATPWSGLTVVMNPDPQSRVLRDGYSNAVAHFMNVPFEEVSGDLEAVLNVVPNDWELVAPRLQNAAGRSEDLAEAVS